MSTYDFDRHSQLSMYNQDEHRVESVFKHVKREEKRNSMYNTNPSPSNLKENLEYEYEQRQSP